MLNYKNYNIKDFIKDRSFQRWVLQNQADDTFFWENWVVLNPDKADIIEKAQYLLLTHTIIVNNISDEEIDQAIDNIIKEIEATSISKSIKWFPVQNVWLRIAASFFIVVGSGLLFYLVNNSFKNVDSVSMISPEPGVSITERTNKNQKNELIILPDGSSVILKKGTRITYPEKFSSTKREVHLAGEAFFEVAKDQTKPFFVYTNNLITRVVGTSFTVAAYEKEQMAKVIVKTGKVRVFSNEDVKNKKYSVEKEGDGLLLIPNQQLVFDNSSGKMTSSRVVSDDIKEFLIQKQTFVFDHTPMDEVFATLENSYGVSIDADTSIRNLELTASLGDEPLYKKVDYICRIMNGCYQQNGEHITLFKNCK